jgi:hypothetical protein
VKRFHNIKTCFYDYPYQYYTKKEIKMSLAQVVYNITTDNEFAAQWQLDPETALVESGLQLSREEFAFLSAGLKNGRSGNDGKVRLSELALLHRGWM